MGPLTSAYSIPSPPSSYSPGDNGDTGVTAAKFEEWPLQNVTLKRIVADGKATFQLQLGWDSCMGNHRATGRSSGSRPQFFTSKSSHRAQRSSATALGFTPEENDLLVELKEGPDMLKWPEIHRRFSDVFPGRRSQGSLQVHYSTKLKCREARDPRVLPC